jgi:predicted dehydrogenase
LKNSTLATGALAGLTPFVGSARAAEPAANNKVQLGLIGCGGMGQGDLQCFFGNPEVECQVICDIDDANLAKGMEICAKRGRKKPDTVKDFRRVLDRKDVDIVLVATPDHWHALPTVLACQAGKDVYVEKPLAKTIAEGRAMANAARKYNRVVQLGSQWRSCKHFIEAGDFAKSGKLGKISMVRGWTYLDWVPVLSPAVDGPVPKGVDYDLWLGPAPQRPFNQNRFHFNFRWFWDYAGGLMTDWGVHLLNMMMMGVPIAAPRTITSSGGKFMRDDASETPDTQVTLYEFPDFVLIWEHKTAHGVGINGRPWGISWTGTEGTVIVNDSGWEVIPEHRKASLEPLKKPGSPDPRPAHVRNFLDCVKSRQTPVLDVELGHQVTAIAHLGNIAFRSGHKLNWDAVNEHVLNDPAADAMVGTPYRAPWKLPT